MKERRVFDERVGQIERERNDRQRDEKYPAPGIIVGDPSAEHWPYCRRENCGDSVKSKRDATLFWGEGIVENRLGHRLEAASTHTLNGSEQKQYGKVRRKSAGQRTQGKDQEGV